MSTLTDKLAELTKQVAANSAVTQALIAHAASQAAKTPAPVDTSAEEKVVDQAISDLKVSVLSAQQAVGTTTTTATAPASIPVTASPFA